MIAVLYLGVALMLLGLAVLIAGSLKGVPIIFTGAAIALLYQFVRLVMLYRWPVLIVVFACALAAGGIAVRRAVRR